MSTTQTPGDPFHAFSHNPGMPPSPEQPPSPSVPLSPPPQKRSRMKLFIILTVVGALLSICSISVIAAALSGGSSKQADKPAVKATATQPATEQPKVVEPTKPVAAVPPADPYAALTAALNKELGKSNRKDVTRVAITEQCSSTNSPLGVTVAFNDNLSKGLVKTAAQYDVIKVLKVVRSAKQYPSTCSGLKVKGTFSMVDTFGKTSESQVVSLFYSSETLLKIQPDGMLRENVYRAADVSVVHPDFR